MIGSTEHPHQARGTIAEAVVAERNARAAVERAGQSEERISKLECRIDRSDRVIAQLQEQVSDLTTKLALMANVG